ncbi:sulfotransferase family 2 domain-containing protein [Pseudohoeflea suaedae]|nr:sulfotransferase family 2 domain-containing protein [Pseudohoeflea suaedae]
MIVDPRTANISVFVSYRHRFMYFPVPKCGSTTMRTVLVKLYGEQGVQPEQDWTGTGAAPVTDAAWFRLTDANLPKFLGMHQGFRTFTIIRAPEGRLMSNYRYRLYVYARFFDKLTYFRAGMFKAAARLKGQDGRRAQMARLWSAISFGDFVRGLQRTGLTWDLHLVPQALAVRKATVRFTDVLHLEQLNEALPETLRAYGVEDGLLAAILPLPSLNATPKTALAISEEDIEVIKDLYFLDYAEFDFGSQTTGRVTA